MIPCAPMVAMVAAAEHFMAHGVLPAWAKVPEYPVIRETPRPPIIEPETW